MIHDLELDGRSSVDGLRAPQDGAPAGAISFLVVDRDGMILEVDPIVIEMLMIPAGDLVGHPFVDHVAPPDRRRVQECFESCVDLRVHAIAEAQLVRRDGSLLLAQLASFPRWEGAASVIGCRIQIHDISALKRAQARLSLVARASAIMGGPLTQPLRLDQVAALVVPSLADACLIDVVDGTGQLRRAAAVIGDDLPGLAAAMPVEGSIVSKESPQWLAFSRGEPLIPKPTVDGTGDGAPAPSSEAEGAAPAPDEVVCLPMRAGDETHGVLTVIRPSGRRLPQADLEVALDLGQRIAQALQNRRALDRSQQTLREREDVLAFVSHDLRNLLTGLFLNTEGILRASPVNERRRGWTKLDRILRGIRFIRRMVDDLSDLNSLESGQLELRLQDESIDDLFNEAVEVLLPTAAEKCIAVVIEPSLRPLWARCDRERIIQVLGRVVANAVKFTPPQGTITVGTALDRDRVVIRVHDTGAGVAQDQLERIFGRTWQEEDGVHKDRGLGLYIAKGIVEAHGGAMWAECQAAQGMTIAIVLPALAREAQWLDGAVGDGQDRSAQASSAAF